MSAPRKEREDARRPCDGCGYMIRGGNLCGDCAEYGAPRGWRWEYDPATDQHAKVARPKAADRKDSA